MAVSSLVAKGAGPELRSFEDNVDHGDGMGCHSQESNKCQMALLKPLDMQKRELLVIYVLGKGHANFVKSITRRRCYFGGCDAGEEFSHSVMWQAVLACRARLISRLPQCREASPLDLLA